MFAILDHILFWFVHNAVTCHSLGLTFKQKNVMQYDTCSLVPEGGAVCNILSPQFNPLSALLTYPGTSWPIPMNRACSQEYAKKIGTKIRQLLREIFQKM